MRDNARAAAACRSTGARPRWAAMRAEMAARGLDCLVLWGWPTMWDFYTANARYLCPIGGNAEFNVLVFPLTGEPTSLHPDADVRRRLAERAGLGRRHPRRAAGPGRTRSPIG